MPLPNFLCLGAQKAGTSTLQHWLSLHPQVFLPPGKEVHYFSLHYDRDRSWYEDHYASAGAQQACGDITPYYLFHPLAAERIETLLPRARLIVLLRDPVERALSGLFHSIRLGLESLPPDQALAAEEERLAGAEQQLTSGAATHHSHQVHSYLARSRYEQQLERYEARFPAEQLLILRSEDLFTEPERICPPLLEFLNLAPAKIPKRLPVHNAGLGLAGSVDPALRGWLRTALEPTYAAMEQRYQLRWS
ncbi:sulfotransferase [Synechococcus sp. WH 5701]|uniref:sulfotransferase family protein n=1 Tax=Synechococcus sp. WH 5701 TaxID=69042 RepID=UPI0009FD0F9B